VVAGSRDTDTGCATSITCLVAIGYFSYGSWWVLEKLVSLLFSRKCKPLLEIPGVRFLVV